MTKISAGNIGIKLLVLAVFCLAQALPVRSQWNDSVQAKIARYGFNKNADLLFVHTDKHIYTNNEFLWFSAYLLQCGQDSLPLHRFLAVALVQAGTRRCIVQQKFAMALGRSFGSLQLPDSIPAGEYMLMASTNMTGNDSIPLARFTQPLFVKSIHQPDFSSFLNIWDDSTGKKEIDITVRDKSSGLSIRDADIVLSLGNKPGIQAKTDKNGAFHVSIPPESVTDTLPVTINARIKYHGDMAYLQKTLPPKNGNRQLMLRFYPEGGQLVANTPCTIGWESRTSLGEPLAVKAVLLKNNNPVDTFFTNEQGLGSFMFIPEKETSYSVLPLALPVGVVSKTHAFNLPSPLKQGISLHVSDALAKDSLRIQIYAAGYTQVKLVVHNFRTVYVAEELQTKAGGRGVLLLLNEVPKGMAAITLLDSLDRPLAERLFFAHYDKRVQVQTATDKKIYGKREKVILTFQLAKNPEYFGGSASIACAQANRYDNRKQQDIESFTLLQSELQDMPVYARGRAYEDTVYLENMLLVRGWRRYTWNEMAMDTLQSPTWYSPALRGKVTGYYKKIRKPVVVSLIGGSANIEMVSTDSAGNFKLGYDQVFTPQDKKLWIASNQTNTPENYVEVLDPFVSINNKAATNMAFPLIDADRFSQSSQELLLKDAPMKNVLAAVTVSAGKDRTIYGSANKCGDYVCPYNILNCSNHPGYPGNRLPQKGQVYNSPGGGQVTYWGCTLEDGNKNKLLLYDGIKTGKEFYGEDFSEKSGSQEEYISTLYWSPDLVFNKEGKAACSFYTGDITGLFRIVINGITNNDLIYATGSFEVK